LFFLDYFATGRLDIDVAESVIRGIGKGCELAGAALVGGETAEMPGMYHDKDYDLAGFCVGVVEKDQIIDGNRVVPGDILIGIASSGPHSNGYSLIRKIIELTNCDLNAPFDTGTLAQILLTPTRIYVKTVLELIRAVPVHALAHITGGGLPENLPRVLPDNVDAVISTHSWQWAPVFRWLQKEGNVAREEMYRTFNCGVGMVACVPESACDDALATLRQAGETAWQIGVIEASSEKGPAVILQ
jgi:phosphoribosylformylglycinamidine cyclo-ligase